MTINQNCSSSLYWIARVSACLITVAIGALGIGTLASAGGWAVSTLDEIPVPTAGESIDIGFTIRAHGVNPVDMTEDVGISVTPAGGAAHYFLAAGDGTVGHYVASVEFPTVGQYRWSISQGWFGEQDLGLIDVGAPAKVVNTGSSSGPLQYIALGGATLFGLVALSDVVMARRRRLSLT